MMFLQYDFAKYRRPAAFDKAIPNSFIKQLHEYMSGGIKISVLKIGLHLYNT